MAEGKITEPSAGDASANTQFSLSVGAGLRNDSLNWNEAGNTINIASELKWENLEIAQIGVEGKLQSNTDWVLSGKLNFGGIISGRNQDSDYNGNDRTLEYSRSNNKGGGEVRDASIGLGKKLQINASAMDQVFSITPLIGLSVHQQNLTLSNGYQTLPATGPYPNLNSTYHAQWQGPWAGIEAQLALNRNWIFDASVEYHWAEYSARANWNLRPEFQHPVSFTHAATGHGISLSASATHQFAKGWHASMIAVRQEWRTRPGLDQTYFSDGSITRYVLNQVNWESTVISFALRHDY